MRGAKVKLGFTSLIRGMTAEEYTDEDGCVDFDGYEDGEVTVYVRGNDLGTYRSEEGETIIVNIDSDDDDD